MLEEAGFTVTARNARVPGVGIVLGLVADDAAGGRWSFDVTGAFTTTRAGLVRADTLWRVPGPGQRPRDLVDRVQAMGEDGADATVEHVAGLSDSFRVGLG